MLHYNVIRVLIASIISLSACWSYAAVTESLTIAFSGSANGIVRSCHCPSAPWGGLAKRAWLLGQLREAAGPEAVVALDSGDLFPVDAVPGRSALMMRLLGTMHYDAVAVGDQELRGGLDSWIAVTREAGFWDDAASRSTFPWISGSYRLTEGPREHQMLVPPWTILERNGLRVGIVSITGPEAWRFAPGMPDGVSLNDPLQTISVFLENTRDQIDLAIVLSHQGLDADRAMAGKLDGIDLIIGGHSQSLISPPEVVNGIALCHVGKNGENLGLLVLSRKHTPAVPQPRSVRGPANLSAEADAPQEAPEENPFLPTVVETPRWRIAQQIIPLTTAVEDDPEAARMIDSYYAGIDSRNASRLADPDPNTPADAPRVTVDLPSEIINLMHGERRSVVVRIANRGGAPLGIERVRSRSPWLEVRSFPKLVAPGEEAEAVLEVVAERIDRFFRCEFSIMANDPHRRVVQAAFSGRIEGPMPNILDVPALLLKLAQLSGGPPPPESLDQAPLKSVQPEMPNEEQSHPSRTVLVEYYRAPGCPDCREIEREILPAFAERFAKSIDFRQYDVTIPSNYLRLARLQERLDIRSNEPVSIYIDGEIPLLGIEAIRASLERVTAERLAGATGNSSTDERSERSQAFQQEVQIVRDAGGITSPPVLDTRQAGVSSVSASAHPPDDDHAPLRRRLEAFTVPAIMLAGLVDGINPCAFAAIVFFITLLSVSGVKAGRLLLVGAGYTLAVFTTYLLMGFGAFRLLQSMHAWQWLADALRWIMIALLAVLALLSFRDAWAFRRSGRPGDVALQLPDRLKRRMHEVMRKRLNTGNLFLSALVIGVLVTLIEAVCTGQVYLPTLVLMSRYAETRARAFSLLLLYNLMFVVPLVIVIGAAFLGTRNQRLIEWSKRNVIWGKIAMGVLFVGLAIVLLFI